MVSGGLQNPDHGGCFAPQVFDAVVLSLGCGEDMHYDLAEIEEHPS